MELVSESQGLGYSFWDTGLGSFGVLLRMGRDGGKHWDNKLATIGGLSAPPSGVLTLGVSTIKRVFCLLPLTKV